MSVINMARNIKEIHPKFLICFKYGSFYNTYGKDAYITNYLFHYKMNKVENDIPLCGFPKKALPKVMAKLEEKKINYMTIDTRNNYDVDDKVDNKNLNTYDALYKKANKYVKTSKKLENITNKLMDQIEDERLSEKIEKIEKIVYEG